MKIATIGLVALALSFPLVGCGTHPLTPQEEAQAWRDFGVGLQNVANAIEPRRYYPPTPVIIPPNYAGTGTIVPGTVRINCGQAGVTCY